MNPLWLASPAPAMRVWPGAQPHRSHVNDPASAWARAAGLAPDAWPAIAAELLAAQRVSEAASGQLASHDLHWKSVPLAPGWLIWLMPAAPGIWGSAEKKLALVQELGAIGIFERNLRTDEARWDAELFRLFGHDPQEGAPGFERALERVHPDDREHLRFAREGGRHGLRYRLVRDDGSVRDLRSLVEVRLDARAPRR